jgi:hypothetical protein
MIPCLTAANPQASDNAERRQDHALSEQRAKHAHASRSAERGGHDADVATGVSPAPVAQKTAPGADRQPGLIMTHDRIALYLAAFGRVPQSEGEQYAADECLGAQE